MINADRALVDCRLGGIVPKLIPTSANLVLDLPQGWFTVTQTYKMGTSPRDVYRPIRDFDSVAKFELP